MKTKNLNNKLNNIVKTLFFVYMIFSFPPVWANSGQNVEEMSILKGEHASYLQAVQKMQDELYLDIASSMTTDPVSVQGRTGVVELKASTL